MKALQHNVQTPRQKIRLEPELSEKDFKIIQDFMNKENGKYIESWKGFSDTDTVPNIQKLALFTRTMRLTKQTNEFLEFNPSQWEIVYEGIVRKPKELILPVFRYKINSNFIYETLSKKTITKEVKENIDGITKFLNMFTVKKDFIGYRGDQSFGILSGIKHEGQNFSLADLMEEFSSIFRDKYLKNCYDKNFVNDFAQKYIIGQDVVQPRCMSIGMTESAIKNYAGKIKWDIKIPAGRKGASIESYNIERLNEAEFLGQRNGVLNITDARYCPKKDLWYFDATLEQNPIDEIIVNC